MRPRPRPVPALHLRETGGLRVGPRRGSVLWECWTRSGASPGLTGLSERPGSGMSRWNKPVEAPVLTREAFVERAFLARRCGCGRPCLAVYWGASQRRTLQRSSGQARVAAGPAAGCQRSRGGTESKPNPAGLGRQRGRGREFQAEGTAYAKTGKPESAVRFIVAGVSSSRDVRTLT